LLHEESPAVGCQAPNSEQIVNKLEGSTEILGKNGTPNQALPEQFLKFEAGHH